MERRVRCTSHARCGVGDKLEITSKVYLSLLRRIWIAWAVINGIGALIAYVAPLFQGLATIEVTTGGGGT